MATYKQIEKVKKRYLVGRVWDPMVHNTSCLLCLRPFTREPRNSSACWDHCHKCGGPKPKNSRPWSFRGFICSLCNVSIPLRFQWRAHHVPIQYLRGAQTRIQDWEWQQRLDKYLRAHKCPTIAPIPPPQSPSDLQSPPETPAIIQ